ncbi:MAG: hypothetical protein WD492_18730 [Alkalispirochaeta sp.]
MDESRFYDRNKLYEEVWSEAVDKVAKRYGVSGVALAKTCRKLKVPLPGRGYWAKHKVGKAPKRPSLPPMKDPPRIYRQGGTEKQSNQAETPEEPNRLRQEVFRDAKRLVEGEKLPENRVTVPATMDSYHPMVEILTPRKKKKRQAITEKWHYYLRDPNETVPGLLNVEVSDEHFDRAARIMSAFIEAMESRGFNVEAEYQGQRRNTSFAVVMEKRVPFRLREQTKRREPTKEEKAKTSYLRYVDEPTGWFTFQLTDHHSSIRRSQWRDTKTRRLEDYLNDIIAAMIMDAAYQIEWQAAVEQRKKEYENVEARRRRERFEQLKEVARESKLEASMERWELFQRRRAYVYGVKAEADCRRDQGEDTSETDIWIRWAEEYLATQNPMSKALPTTGVTEEDLRKVDQHFYYSEYRKLQREQSRDQSTDAKDHFFGAGRLSLRG